MLSKDEAHVIKTWFITRSPRDHDITNKAWHWTPTFKVHVIMTSRIKLDIEHQHSKNNLLQLHINIQYQIPQRTPRVHCVLEFLDKPTLSTVVNWWRYGWSTWVGRGSLISIFLLWPHDSLFSFVLVQFTFETVTLPMVHEEIATLAHGFVLQNVRHCLKIFAVTTNS